jgi:hypothetical protein
MVAQHGCQGLLIAVLDRNPPVFDAKSHTVTLPEAFKQSVRIVQDAGWDKVSLHDAVGASTCWAMSWLFSVVKLRSAIPAPTPSA